MERICSGCGGFHPPGSWDCPTNISKTKPKPPTEPVEKSPERKIETGSRPEVYETDAETFAYEMGDEDLIKPSDEYVKDRYFLEKDSMPAIGYVLFSHRGQRKCKKIYYEIAAEDVKQRIEEFDFNKLDIMLVD